MSQNELHVIFGSGPPAKWTARELLKLGKTVRLINYSGKADRLPAEVEVVAGDAEEVNKTIALTRGAVTVYQCAQPHYYDLAKKLPLIYENILKAVAANGAKLVVADNLYMYGQFTGVLREDSPLAPNTSKGKIYAKAARLVLDAHASGKVRAAIGRASDFFGPDDTILTGYAIRPAVSGKPVSLLGSDSQPHTFTYIADFGRLLATLGTRDEALGQVWFAPSNPPLTQAELVKLVETELGRPVKSVVDGPRIMRFMSLFNPAIHETVEMMFEWVNPYVVDTTKAQHAFGLSPTPMAAAIRETIAWCREAAPQADVPLT